MTAAVAGAVPSRLRKPKQRGQGTETPLSPWKDTFLSSASCLTKEETIILV